MAPHFFYGSLRHLPLLQAVLGDISHLSVQDATLAEHAVFWAKDHGFPLIQKSPGGVAAGLLVKGLTANDVERLDFYEGGFDYALHNVRVRVGKRDQTAQVFFPHEGVWQTGDLWHLEDWVEQWVRPGIYARIWRSSCW